MAEDLELHRKEKPARLVAGELKRPGGKVKFEAGVEGRLSVYSFRKVGSRYYIGGDCCKGQSNSEDADYACAQVFDRYTWEQVAVWHGRVEASEFAREMEGLGYFYNKAHLIPESNDHGNTVCVKLQEWHYPDLYVRQQFDALGTKTIKKPGFETNKKTRPLLVDSIDSSINSSVPKLNDIPTLEELLTFVRHDKTGKPQAARGCHDDRVIAVGLAFVIMETGEKTLVRESTVIPERTGTIANDAKRAIRRARSTVMDGGNKAGGGDSLLTYHGT
jgi:hypothetical protein